MLHLLEMGKGNVKARTIRAMHAHAGLRLEPTCVEQGCDEQPQVMDGSGAP
jgi:hypothetical protein